MINLLDAPIAGDTLPAQDALRITAEELDLVLRNGTRVLSDVTLCVEPGQLVAVIGASGAGKTTLLETLAGLRRASSGQVRYDGQDVDRHLEAFRGTVGYVPQDDIIHRDLPVRVTLRHAARLRLPRLGATELDDVVDGTIAALGLTDRPSTIVSRLSGGQRKRVSIAVELLTRPRAFFLDEPTSGLDPGTARNLLATLRSLADDGSTVVLTTHNPDDVESCDRVVVLARGGRLAFHGTPAEALAHFGVSDLAEVYRRLDDEPEPPARQASAVRRARTACPTDSGLTADAVRPAAASSAWHQWKVLCRRNVDVLARNRLTLAIMLGTPALVIAMFAVLFRSDAFDAVGGDPSAAIGTTYWLAFAGFFFGLTYGLLQVVTESAIVRRERHVGLRPGAYLLAKLAVLVPVLLAVNAGMVVALQLTGRLPDLSWSQAVTLVAVLLLDAVVALALGLLASAAVTDPSHATLALPLLCFPAVLFGGAVLPVRAMAGAGRLISVVTPDRWAFEALGRELNLDARFTSDGFVTAHHGGAFTGGLVSPSLFLVLFGAAFLAAGVGVLRRRTAVR
jgi:ABC-type multidrug transport system ATPase subunit